MLIQRNGADFTDDDLGIASNFTEPFTKLFTIFFFVAALSPTADPLSMVLLSGPLILFYFMAGLIAVLVDRRRDKKADSVETGSAGIEAPTSIKE